MKGWSSEGHADDTGHLKTMQMTLGHLKTMQMTLVI
jgi:hypothetical protein